MENQDAPKSTVTLVKMVLPLGDFILETNDGNKLAIIERKSLPDLMASIKDSRYEEQSYRLSKNGECSPQQIIYIIEGSMNTLRTWKERRLIQSVITSLRFFKGFCPMRTGSQQETAELLVGMADKMERNLQKGVPLFPLQRIDTLENLDGEQGGNTTTVPYCNVVKKVKKDNITPENIGEIMLCQVPGISSVTAIAIMKQFSSFFHLLESCKNDPTCLENIQYECKGKMRKISKSSIASIYTFFLHK
jgi:ERCC4-type nuclease